MGGANTTPCPLDFTLFDSRPWMIQQCTQPDRTHCCEVILYLVRILLFSRMDHTTSFLLPDNHTAAVCVDALKANLEARSVAPKGLEDCKLDFALSGSCNKITNLARFEKAVDTMPMNKYCKGASGFDFQCHQCVTAMVIALRQLQIDAFRSGEKKTSCDLYVLLYVGGVINVYNNLGFDAAYCLLGVHNLSQLASPRDGSHEIPEENFKSSQRVKIALWISIPVGAMFILLLAIYASLKKRRQSQMLTNKIDLKINSFIFSFSDIKESTGSFSTSNVIGEGGFSTVYKGTLPDGSLIAVKKFKDSATKADQVFRHEIQVISGIKHRNLLPLKGYCICHGMSDPPQHFMVYDFMANGSVADYLFKGNKPCLTWSQRYKIAVGIARGLAYLHNDAKPAIIHRDIKAANVLLDGDLNPLLADFGLARFKDEDRNKSHHSTKAVGTLGYVAPEYALYGHLTDKSDVFSFGILLLELMSGRKVLDYYSGGDQVENATIFEWANDLIGKGRWEELIDSRIHNEWESSKENMKRVIEVAVQCAQQRAVCRPSIQEVLAILEYIYRPLSDIISVFNIAVESAVENREESIWLLSSNGEETIKSNGGAALDDSSMNSYNNGR
eukprot:Gb_09214 [translate_table: standard]